MVPAKPISEVVASIIMDRGDADFIRALMAVAAEFADPTLEESLSTYLRTRPDLVDRWATYSADQRWTPAAFVDGTVAGWYDSGYRDVVQHPDEAAAVADFIHRTAAYLNATRAEVPKQPSTDT